MNNAETINTYTLIIVYDVRLNTPSNYHKIKESIRQCSEPMGKQLERIAYYLEIIRINTKPPNLYQIIKNENTNNANP